jgi:hypothetical protein
MPAQNVESLRTRIETVVALSRLLDRVERTATPIGADQYRSLVRQLQQVLSTELPPEALKAVFNAYPSAAELYENMHYATAGLALASLDLSVKTEMAASELLQRLRRSPPADAPGAAAA